MKKHRIKLLAILFIVVPMTAYGVNYTLTAVTYPINVNGQKLAVQPLNLNGTTYLPLRSISKAVGVPITWTGKSVEINTLDVDKLKEACVMIRSESSTKWMQGSAVCWDYGEYLTANHIVDEGKTNIVSPNGLKVGETDAQLDIATLTTDGDIKPVKIGDSDEVKVGDAVIFIGSPSGNENIVKYYKVEISSTKIVLNGAIEGGASGGGVFNMQGELIGILTSANNAVKDCYVIPINAIRKAL